LNVGDVDEAHLVKVFAPIQKRIPETASRVRQRVESVLGYAIVSKLRSGPNPATWKGHLQTLLGGGRKENGNHHAAMPFAELPTFMPRLRAKKSLSATALEFTILTAARTGETIGARWDEIDFRHRLWVIPAARMKAARDHRVPLSDRAIEILREREKHRKGDLVFGTAVTGKPLSNMAMLELLRGMHKGATVHGFRSTFRDWASERTNYPNHVMEMALAHIIDDKVEAAYRRGDLLEKRQQLMAAWERFISRPLPAKGATVTDIRAAR
jgi:integrase